MAHDVFISHSTSNRPVANAVCAALESAGIRCWIAPRDVMPGRSYSGEITRAIQQSRAFVLIFSEHSNNSEQVLREVQLAANSRLHIVQFRIDPVSPSDDLEYYLSGPHWLDAVTPPLEGHLEQLRNSVKALLTLPRAGEGDKERASAPPSPPVPSPPPSSQNISPLSAPAFIPAKPATNVWKWVALGVGLLAVLGCAGLALILALVPAPRMTRPPSNFTPAAQTTAPLQSNPSAGTAPTLTQPSVPVAPASTLVEADEVERYINAFYRDLERGDLSRIGSYLDDSVDYYSFGQKDKAFITEYTRQFLAVLPSRTFVVSAVKVQDSSKPMVATITFDVRYSARDVLGNPNTGHTRVEWDVTRRQGQLKIIRTNWMTYPDPSPPP
jgi:TIR domain